MSGNGDEQSFHIPGPHSERPAGHDVPTSVAGERSQRSESLGTQNPAVRALTELSLAEGATAGSDRQTRSKGQAVPVCLGPLDKPIFDERFAVPIGDEQFIEGTKELYDSGKTPAPRHIVKSALRCGARSKIHQTPTTSVSSSEGDLPYPIRPSIFYTADDPSIGEQRSSSAKPSQSQEHTSPHRQRGAADRTSHSSGRATHLKNQVNPPDESVLDLVNPLSLPRGAPSSFQTPVRPQPEGFSLTAPERKKKGKVSSLWVSKIHLDQTVGDHPG